ncbi:hypothetical protein Hanom_Chr14g01300111 [Helianthus anomalus]
MSVDQTYFQICHAPASLERCIMPGMRPLSTGCVLITKPNKKWTRGYGMRPSNTGCVLGAWDESGKFLMRLFLSHLSLSSLSFFSFSLLSLFSFSSLSLSSLFFML